MAARMGTETCVRDLSDEAHRGRQNMRTFGLSGCCTEILNSEWMLTVSDMNDWPSGRVMVSPAEKLMLIFIVQ